MSDCGSCRRTRRKGSRKAQVEQAVVGDSDVPLRVAGLLARLLASWRLRRLARRLRRKR
jgi:hypothetical protein